jgi:hypothetical protein
MPTRKPKTDKRLLGTWRSDRRLTLKDWVWRRGWPAQKRKKFASIFGHLTLRYTRSRLYSDYRGHKAITKYEVIALDSDSVAIRSWDSLLKEWRIRHIHFAGDHYWISIASGWNKEWFKQVTKSAG